METLNQGVTKLINSSITPNYEICTLFHSMQSIIRLRFPIMQGLCEQIEAPFCVNADKKAK